MLIDGLHTVPGMGRHYAVDVDSFQGESLSGELRLPDGTSRRFSGETHLSIPHGGGATIERQDGSVNTVLDGATTSVRRYTGPQVFYDMQVLCATINVSQTTPPDKGGTITLTNNQSRFVNGVGFSYRSPIAPKP